MTKNITGRVPFEVRVSELTTNGNFSEIVEIVGIPWKLNVHLSNDSNEYLEVYAYCDVRSQSEWSCDAHVNFYLMRGNERGLTRELEHCFNSSSSNQGKGQLIKKEVLLLPESGYVKNGKFTIVADIEIISTIGFPIMTKNITGRVPFEVSVSELTTDYNFSEIVEIDGIPWKLNVRLSNDSIEYLEVHADCDVRSNSEWSCDAHVNFYLMRGNERGLTREFNVCFTSSSSAFGLGEFIKKDILLLPESEYVKNGKFTIVADIEIISSIGLPIMTKNITGRVPFEVRVSELKIYNSFTEIVEIDGIPWKLSVSLSKDSTEYLEVYAYCDVRSKSEWSCDAYVSFYLMRGNERGLTRELEHCFNSSSSNHGLSQLIKKEVLLLPESGYVINGKFTIVADIEIISSIGLPIMTKNITGRVPFEVRVSELTKDYNYSETVEIDGIPWKLNVRLSKDSNEYLEVYAFCDVRSQSEWSCDANVNFYLMRGNEQGLTREFNDCFTSSSSAFGLGEFIKKDILLLPESEYVKNGKFTIVADIEIISSIGLPIMTKNITGRVPFEVRVSELTTDYNYSETVEIDGIPWKLCVCLSNDSNEYLEVYAFCDVRSQSEWSCDANVNFYLMRGNERGLTRNLEHCFNSSSSNQGKGQFIKKEVLLLPESGYVKNGTFTIVAEIEIVSTVVIKSKRTEIQNLILILSDKFKLLEAKEMARKVPNIASEIMNAESQLRNYRQTLENLIEVDAQELRLLMLPMLTKNAVDEYDKVVAKLEEDIHVVKMKEIENKAQIQQVKRDLEFNMLKFEQEQSKIFQITNDLDILKKQIDLLETRFSEIKQETIKVAMAMAKGERPLHTFSSFSALINETIRGLNNFSGIGSDTREKAANDDELKAIREKLSDFKSKFEELIEVIDEYEPGEADKDRGETAKKIRDELKTQMIEIQSRIKNIKPPRAMSQHPAELAFEQLESMASKALQLRIHEN